MPAVGNVPNTIAFNVMPPFITPTLASNKLAIFTSKFYFLAPLMRVPINPGYFMVVCIEIFNLL